MVHTVDFKDIAKEASRNDTEFRNSLFGEVIELLLKNDVITAQEILYNYVVEVIGIKKLSKDTSLSVNDIERILGVEKNPTINEFFFLINALQETMKVSFDIIPKK